MTFRLPLRLRRTGVRYMASGLGDFGSGAGKGGGSGGPVREAGGGFGRMEAAHEEMYFKKLQAVQLKQLREHIEGEVEEHEKAIRKHQEVIDRHKKKIGQIAEHENEASTRE